MGPPSGPAFKTVSKTWPRFWAPKLALFCSWGQLTATFLSVGWHLFGKRFAAWTASLQTRIHCFEFGNQLARLTRWKWVMLEQRLAAAGRKHRRWSRMCIGPKTKTEAASSHLRLLCFQNLFNFRNRSKQTCFHCPSRALLMQRHGLISLLLECSKGVPDSSFAQAQYLHKKLQRAVNSPSYFPVSKKTTQAKSQRLWKERRQAFYTREPFFVVTLLPWAKALDSKHPARGKILWNYEGT